ncbi:MAG: MlaD family protein [Solirubrobacterales bacterium]
MIKRAPSPGQLAGMVAFAFSCFALVLFLWVSFGGPVPLRPQGYRVNASFDEAVQLSSEADVRISGVSVGKVKKVSPSVGRTQAVIELEDRYAPLPVDVKAQLRTKTLLGETYVQLTPGTKGKPTIPENGNLPATSVSPLVELDEVIRTFDPATRRAFSGWLVGQAAAGKNRGDDLNQAFGVLPVFFSDANDLMSELRRQDRALSRVFANTADIFEAIDSRPGQLTELIESSNRLLAVTARRSEQLAESFRGFPAFLRESRLSVKQFTKFTRDTQPLIENTTAFAEEFSPTIKKASKVTDDARILVNNLEPLLDRADAGLPAADEFFTLARPTLGQADAFLRQLNPVLEFVGLYDREINAFLANDAAASQAQYTPTSAGAKKKDQPGHYLRAFTTLAPESLAYLGNRTTASRSNPYPAPGWFDRLAAGLQVFDSAQCGSIPVPVLNPDDSLYPADLKALIAQINQIVYAGSDQPAPNGTPTSPLPAPVCSEQVPQPFSGQSGKYPHVLPRSSP